VGIVAVMPRMGSVSSCSGEGRASGDNLTRAAAQRKVAAAVVTSGEDRGTSSELIGKVELLERRLVTEFLAR
jgi:hypothetical protein